MKGLESESYEKWLGLFILGKGSFRGDLIAFDNSLKGGCGEVGLGLFSQATSNGAGGNALRGGSDWKLGRISSWNGLLSTRMDCPRRCWTHHPW